MKQTFAVGETVIRHGDVLLKVSDKKARGRRATSGLLHQGTQHSHYLKGGSFVLDRKAGLLTVTRQTSLTHEEHKTIKVPAGTYSIDIQREYDHHSEESRKVID